MGIPKSEEAWKELQETNPEGYFFPLSELAFPRTLAQIEQANNK